MCFIKDNQDTKVIFLAFRRICPAIYLAEVEIFIAFVELLARCFIEPAASGMPDIGGAKNAGLTLMPIPYKVKFTKRADFLKCT